MRLYVLFKTIYDYVILDFDLNYINGFIYAIYEKYFNTIVIYLYGVVVASATTLPTIIAIIYNCINLCKLIVLYYKRKKEKKKIAKVWKKLNSNNDNT